MVRTFFKIILTIIIGLALYFKYNDFAYKSYERSILENLLGAFSAFQESYKSEFKTYNINTNEVRKLLFFTDEVEGYVRIDDVPEEYREKLIGNDEPRLNKDDYKVAVLITSKKYHRVSLWTFDNFGNKKEIYAEIK